MKISVITVCYNSERTIENCLRSIQAQTYEDVEVVVIDGGSTDRTLSLTNEIYPTGAVILSEKDSGIYYAMNKGVKLASGDVIHFLNSDDCYSNDLVLEKVAKKFMKDGSDICYGSIAYINQERELIDCWIPSKFYKGSYRNGWHCPHPGFFARRSLFSEIGDFDTDLHIAADFDLMKRFMEHATTTCSRLTFEVVKMQTGGASSRLGGIVSGYRDIKKSFRKDNVKVSMMFFFKRYFFKLIRKFRKLK